MKCRSISLIRTVPLHIHRGNMRLPFGSLATAVAILVSSCASEDGGRSNSNAIGGHGGSSVDSGSALESGLGGGGVATSTDHLIPPFDRATFYSEPTDATRTPYP